jgi:hypothetical protein
MVAFSVFFLLECCTAAVVGMEMEIEMYINTGTKPSLYLA